MKQKVCIAGVVLGVIMLILGIVVLSGSGGDTDALLSFSGEEPRATSFGGDFYTYSYKASRAAANNLADLGELVEDAIGVLLMAFGAGTVLLSLYGYAGCRESGAPGQVIIAAQGETVANAPAIKSAGTFVPPVPAAGTFWRCQCGIRNEESSRSCTICGRDKPGTSTQVSAPVSASPASNSQLFSWLKDKRDAVTKLVDRINGDDKPEMPLAMWHCSACGADHPASKGSCDVCGAAKPKAGAKH